MAERFWSKVDVRGADECWPWTAYADRERGYGQFWNGEWLVGAHRYAADALDYEGVVDHLCHNEVNTYINPRGHRKCRPCRRIHQSHDLARKKVP